MKNQLIAVTFAFLLGACGSNTTTEFDQEVVDIKYAEGKAVYNRQCVSCHQPDGLGMEGVFPPLANSDYLLADKKRAGKQVMEGLKGPIVVNGVDYDGIMPPQLLSQEEAKQVIDYILNSWGNNGGEIDLNDIPQKSNP